LLFSTIQADGVLWTADDVGLTASSARVGGRVAQAGDRVWAYDGRAVYLLDAETLSVESSYALPSGSAWLGSLVGLSDGGALVVHVDRYDRRIVALNRDGSVRWQRSFASVIQEYPYLVVLGDQPYLVALNEGTSGVQMTVFAIDLETAELTRIFVGGGRDPTMGGTWVHPSEEDLILVGLADSGIVALDAPLALDIIQSGLNPQ
jgi:hypothetical protein